MVRLPPFARSRPPAWLVTLVMVMVWPAATASIVALFVSRPLAEMLPPRVLLAPPMVRPLPSV